MPRARARPLVDRPIATLVGALPPPLLPVPTVRPPFFPEAVAAAGDMAGDMARTMAGSMADDIADDCAESHSTLKSRRTQMGTLGYLNLLASTTLPARSLATRTVSGLRVERSALPPITCSPSPPASSSSGSGSGSDGDADGLDGWEADLPPPLEDGSDSDASDSASSTRRRDTGPRAARRPRRLLGRARLESTNERQHFLAGHIGAALRRLLGMRTLVGASNGSGMMAQVIGHASSSSRFLFCVTGPQAVDLAALWLSPDGTTLCSCWGHTENVALLSMAGEDSTCWHAQAFKAALKDHSDHSSALSSHLRVTRDVQPYAADISTFRGAAAAAFDGVIYSPVVATRRCHVKCIAVGCRSIQRRCHHATLVRKLDRLAPRGGENEGSSDESADDEGLLVEKEEEVDELVIEEELVTISKARQKRNLVACAEEDRQGLMWARTAEWTTVDVPATAIFFSASTAVDGQAAIPAKQPTLVGRMAELGLAFDPSVTLREKRCCQCGAQQPDGAKAVEAPAFVYTDGNGAAPLKVCFPTLPRSPLLSLSHRPTSSVVSCA